MTLEVSSPTRFLNGRPLLSPGVCFSYPVLGRFLGRVFHAEAVVSDLGNNPLPSLQ
jgi:hypothetical protein